MKELSIEDKAKAYDEVISKLKGFMAQGVDPLITRADVQDFFPELKESEDEKIRKTLIRFHKSTIDIDGIKGEDIIAWLEKQGEQKPAWSYEDEANLNNIIWLCNNCIKGTETTWIPSQATKIKHLIETIKEEGLAQQNPAWSDEDEQITLSIEQVMNCASLLNIVPEKVDKIRTWLKSLKDRCTWKPSSLQMECLHDAIKHYHTNGYPASKLKELYEQMSKIYKL